MKRQVYGFAAILCCWLLPSLALAQAPADDNITERPNAAVCIVSYMDPNLGSGLRTCYVLDPTTFLDITTHLECHPYGTAGPGVTNHQIIVPNGDGSMKVWGVIVRSPSSPGGSPSISNVSEFWKECQDVPMRPIQLSGHPPLEDRIA